MVDGKTYAACILLIGGDSGHCRTGTPIAVWFAVVRSTLERIRQQFQRTSRKAILASRLKRWGVTA